MSKERFEFIRPDEFAECTDGVMAAGDLYERLWSFVPRYTAPRSEVSEEPIYGADSLASFWDELTAEEQAKIVELQDAQDEQVKVMMREYYTGRGEPIPANYL